MITSTETPADSDKQCANCGKRFSDRDGFVTCYGCRKRDTVQRTGCSRFDAKAEQVAPLHWQEALR